MSNTDNWTSGHLLQTKPVTDYCNTNPVLAITTAPLVSMWPDGCKHLNAEIIALYCYSTKVKTFLKICNRMLWKWEGEAAWFENRMLEIWFINVVWKLCLNITLYRFGPAMDNKQVKIIMWNGQYYTYSTFVHSPSQFIPPDSLPPSIQVFEIS